MLYAVDAAIVLRSPQELAKRIEIIVEACRVFVLTVSVRTIETRCMPPPRTPQTMVRVETAVQIYKQVKSLTYLGSVIAETRDIYVEIARRTRACWIRVRRHLRELYDQSKLALSLKTRMLKAEATEAPLYGCSTWTLHQEHGFKPRTVHHRVLLRLIGARGKRPDYQITSNTRVLEITRCGGNETTLLTITLSWAAVLIRMSGGWLPNKSCSEILRVQCGMDGAGRRKSGPIAYGATSGYLG